MDRGRTFERKFFFLHFFNIALTKFLTYICYIYDRKLKNYVKDLDKRKRLSP